MQLASDLAVGSQIKGAEGVEIQARASDLTVRGSDVSSDTGKLALIAKGDVAITAASEQQEMHIQSKSTSRRVFSSSSRQEVTDDVRQSVRSSSVSGNTVQISAGHDLAVAGSSVISDQGTVLQAGNDLAIQEVRSTDEFYNRRVEKSSGLMGSGGIGVMVGSREQGQDGTTRITHATGSTIGALSGDVTLLAGQRYTQTGSSVSATGVNGGGDVNIKAKDIAITEARETARSVTNTWFKQSGLTLAVTSPVLSAIQTGQQMSRAARRTSDSRMKALAAASTGMSAYSAYKAVDAGQGQTIDGKANQIVTDKAGPDGKPVTRDANAADKAGGIGISISVGSSSSKSHSVSSSDTSAGSQINAAGSINLVATGADKDSNILIQGSDLKAAKDIALAADKQIQLLASRDSSEQHSQNSGRSGSVGIGFQLGGSGSGLMLTASASGSRGHADGTDVAYRNTHLNAGESVRLSSGGDTALKGAVVAAKSIDANIGGHLAIESLQDATHYDSRQQSLGGSVSVGFGMMGGSVSYARSKIDSDFRSVGEQSGLLAGDGGFNIKVAGDTTLKGAVITSTDAALQAQNNQFETGGTLAMSDLHNHAEYAASSVSVSVGTSAAGSSIGFGSDSGSADSESRSGISGIAGNRNARSGDAQTGLKPIFDADKVQQEIDAQTQITQSFGQQASKLVGDYAAAKVGEANTLKAQAIVARTNGHEAEADQFDLQAKQILNQWGDNGRARIALHTAIGGLTGGAAGAAGSLTGTVTAAQTAGLLESAGITQKNNPALYNSVVGLASTATGAVVGSTTGAGAAFNEVSNNKLLHDDQLAAIARLAHGNKDKGDRFFAAACYLIKCSAEFASGSKEYATFSDLEKQGGQYTAELTELKDYSYTEQQPSLSGYPAIGNTVTHKDLFNYNNEDSANDGMALARNYRIQQFQKSGMSLTAAKLAVSGVDFGMLMLGTIGGKSLGKIPLASLSQEEQIALRAAERKVTKGAAAALDESLTSLNSPAMRHYADKVKQTSLAKEVNTVVDRSVVDMSADIAAIRSGEAKKVGDTFIVNGRTYGVHNGTLHPIAGPGLYTLDRGGYKALGVLNKFGDTPRADVVLRNMGVSVETKAAALKVFKAINK
jgi:filamentous hemagglutinin